MEPKPIVELHTHFRHPTDEQLRHVDICFLATKIICSLSTLICSVLFYIKRSKAGDRVHSQPTNLSRIERTAHRFTMKAPNP